MKRRDLIKKLVDMGCVMIRDGSKHDWYMNPETRISQPIPRHNEINDQMCKRIIKILSEGD